MTTPPENTGTKPPPVNPDNLAVDAEIYEFGASPRTFTAKAWEPGKPPGGRVPTDPTAQDQSISPPAKPAK